MKSSGETGATAWERLWMLDRQTMPAPAAECVPDSALLDSLGPQVLPAYVEEAIANYRQLGDYLRAFRPSLGDAVVPRFDAESRDRVIASYLASDETAPLLIALEDDIRRLLADPAFRVAAGSGRPKPPQSPLKALAQRFGIGGKPAALPPRPALKALLVARSTDDKAALLTRSLLRLLKTDPSSVDPLARVAAFTRISRFAAGNPTRDRKLVDAAFAAGRPQSLLLADAALAGHSLYELEPFVLHQAARQAAATHHDQRTIALCRRFFQLGAVPVNRAAMAELGAQAALRSGDDAAARDFAAEWHALGTTDILPLLIEVAASDTHDRLDRLIEAGAGEGTAGPLAAVVAAGLLQAGGDIDGAEKAVRAALATPMADRMDLLAALHNLHVARGQPINCLDGVFAGHGNAVRWRRFHPSDMLDAGPGSGESGSATFVSVILPARRGGSALRTTVESILAQSHGALELILVPCGGAPFAIAADLTRDARVAVLPHAPGTIGDALNAGVARATGKLFAVATEGDFWLRDLLADHLQARRGAPALLATTALSLPVADDGSVPRGRLGHHVERDLRVLVAAARIVTRAGGFDPVEEGAVLEFLGRVHLHGGSGAVGSLDRILSVVPARSADGGLPPGEAEALRTAAYRTAWNERHLASLRSRSLPVASTRLRPASDGSMARGAQHPSTAAMPRPPQVEEPA